ncbi:MAG: hypothetical protein ACREJ9_14070 [Candidatus Rokuibacteriota bacterium]
MSVSSALSGEAPNGVFREIEDNVVGEGVQALGDGQVDKPAQDGKSAVTWAA